LALGYYDYKQRSITIHDAIEVIGFNNEELLTQVRWLFLRLNQFSEALGSKAAKLLINEISLRRENNCLSAMGLGPQLILRESSARNKIRIANEKVSNKILNVNRAEYGKRVPG
jgi:DNA-binding LacI/PurR family transcriptional regulator